MFTRNPSGFTLVEVLISTSILFTALAISLSAITGLAGAGRTVDRRNEMVVDSQVILKSLSDDVALSGWAPYDCTTSNFSAAYSVDRTIRYYPYVIQQAPSAASASTRLPNVTDAGGGLQAASPTWFQNIDTNWFVRPNQFVDVKRFNPSPDLPPSLGRPTDFSKNFSITVYPTPYDRDKDYRTSFYARSQELILVRASVGGWSATPGIDTTPIIKFPNGDWTSASKDVGGGIFVKDNHAGLGIIKMSEWQLGDANSALPSVPDLRNPTTFYWNRPSAPVGMKQIPVAVNQGAMLSPQSDPGNLVQIRWDTMVDPAASQINMTLPDPHPVIEFPAGNARIKSRQLREYAYLVVPSRIGAGRFVRAHTAPIFQAMTLTRAPDLGDCIGNGTDPLGNPISLIIDKIYSDNCMRVVFDTYRSVGPNGGLSPNQIRVTLYFAMGNARPGDAPVTYKTSTLLTMRVLNSSVDNDSISTLLGPIVPGLAY